MLSEVKMLINFTNSNWKQIKQSKNVLVAEKTRLLTFVRSVTSRMKLEKLKVWSFYLYRGWLSKCNVHVCDCDHLLWVWWKARGAGHQDCLVKLTIFSQTVALAYIFSSLSQIVIFNLLSSVWGNKTNSEVDECSSSSRHWWSPTLTIRSLNQQSRLKHDRYFWKARRSKDDRCDKWKKHYVRNVRTLKKLPTNLAIACLLKLKLKQDQYKCP